MAEGEEKTEQPSEFKLREARKKGQVAKSADVVALCSLSCALVFFAFFIPFCLQQMTDFFHHLFFDLRGNINPHLIKSSTRKGLDLWFLLSAPILFMAALGAVIGSLSQFGFLLSSHPIKPDVKKMNPVEGIKKLFSKDRLVELIKQVVKFSVVFWIIWTTVKDSLRNISMLTRTDLGSALMLISELVASIVIRVVLCFVGIAIFDFFWQRHSFLKKMRMSKYEVKKEYIQQEGDPQIKHERKRMHQEAIENAATEGVRDASVVITNPSHIAVALRYDDAVDMVPTVIAKGIGARAKVIIDEANRNRVPIMRNVPLARDLQWLEINEEIPKNLYDSVAEVLTFVFELNQKASKPS